LAGNDLYTPLHWAARKGNLDVVKLLLENGANPNAVDNSKNTPLHKAAGNGPTEVARLLLDSGADATLANDAYDLDFEDEDLSEDDLEPDEYLSEDEYLYADD
jgi:ankyrin repeat protein